MNSNENNTANQETTLSWRVHPFRESFKISVIVIAIIAFICSIVYISFGGIFWVVLSFVFLFVSLSSFFFPTTFFLDEKEVKVKRVFSTIKRSWDRFKGFYWDKNGVQLTPFTYPSRLDAYRGLFLKFGNNKDEVINFIKKHLSPVSKEKRENSQKADE
ncbi:hypothetical protein KKB18_00860 [bacterium]|nr:hypothetical protein [bacterium]